MGGGFTKPKLPPIRKEAPFPTVDPIGIGKGMGEGCQTKQGGVCQLAVAAGVSASGAKLYREMGSITREKCKKYSEDTEKVRQNKMAFEEFRKGLLDGIYYRDLGNNYCGQIVFDAADLDKVSKLDDLDIKKARTPLIRAVSSSGGFSSITKAFIKPSIPFEVEFNGRPHKINVLTIMHPSPIRVENVQHDAMLTLGDPGDGNNDGLVILVPLVGSLMAGASGAFIAKIARYMSGILTPNPATGQYESIDIPTGSDWKLSSIFPGAPGGDGKTYVKSPGYYIWSGQPPLDLAYDRTEYNGGNVVTMGWVWEAPNADYYSWKPTGQPGIRYIMLSEPVQVNSMDLQTILMLPSTPITEAISPMVKSTLSYRKAGSIGTDGRWVTECPARLPKLTNFFGGTRETFEDTCDPFAPGSFPSTAPDTSSLVKLVIGLVGAFGVFLSIYFAVKLWTQLKPGRWLADKGEQVGNAVAQFTIADSRKWVAPAGMFKVSEEEEEAERKAAVKKAADSGEMPGSDGKAAEARLSSELHTAPPKAKKKEKKEDTDMAKAVEASLKQKEKEDAEDAKTKEEDAKRKEEDEAYDAAEERKRAAEEEVLRRNGPAGTGLDLTDAQLARNLEGEEPPAGRPSRRTRTRMTTPTAGPSAVDRALAKKKQADTAKLQAEADATNALFAEAKARKEKETLDAAAAVEADIKKEKEKLEAAEEARIKALSEQAAASASDVATKTLKRRNVQSSERDLAKFEAERKRQAEEYAEKQREAILAAEPGAPGRASASVPTSKGERPPAAPAAPATSSLMALTEAERLKGQINSTMASIAKQEVFINANPPTKEHPNRIFNQRLETRLNATIKDLDRQLTQLEAAVAKFPADKGLEKMGMTRFIKQTQEKEKKSLTAQNQRFEVLGKIIKEGPAMKGGRRKRLKRKSTRRYVA
jgi:hypothetical protein